MLSKKFKTILEERYAPKGYIISEVEGTRHWNVLKMHDPAEKKFFIAKAIIHVEDDEEMGPAQMNAAFLNEVNILSKLPDWWGLYLVDSFKEDIFRIIVTPEIQNCPWNGFKRSLAIDNEKVIATKLYKQIQWLHRHGIIHGDVELKNILLSCDYNNAVIIDFEKSKVDATKTEMKNEYEYLIRNLKGNEITAGIGAKLARLVSGTLSRSHSVGGRRKRKTRKNKFV
jgi:serine/threonine protein kinase